MDVAVSRLTPYSIGHVAANKPLNSNFIEVTLDEEMPIKSGELGDNATDYNTTGIDSNGSTYQVSTTMKQTVKAEWIPVGTSNRMTSPDVRRGELVMVYKFSDADKFYWNTLKNDLAFRKLETVIYAFGATKDESVTPDQTNSYFVEVSTHRGLIAIRTSKANGEPFRYDIVLNTKEGHFSIMDDVGNIVGMHSTDTRIMAKNKDATLVDLNKKKLTMEALESVNILTKDFTLAATDSVTVSTKSSVLTADTNNVSAATTNSGTFVQTIGPSGNSSSMTGTLNVTGRITGDAEINVVSVISQRGAFSEVCTAPNIK